MAQFLYTIIIYPLVQIIEFAFVLFDDVFKKPGISVIGVSLAVSVLCLPLYIVAERWQQIQRSLEKKLEPGIARIKSVFKGDEQYMILSVFYRQNHYHPVMALRSSFGLLIQIPFFIAAYVFLSNLSSVQGESFLFIRDMGKPDALFRIGSFPVNILPIAMTAINIVAGAVYTKGFRLKEKVQIYGMALIFLVILYNSPSGLVLYWTMNNVFSLVKNIFYKIKNPARVLYLITAAAVVALDYYLLAVHHGFLHKRVLMAAVCSLLLLAPPAVKGVKYLLDTLLRPLVEDGKARFSLFIVSALSLCLLAGFVIPSFVISSSPVEFADIDGFGNPLHFLLISTLQSFGLLVFWPLCVYFLFREKIQTLIALFLPLVLLIGLTDAFAFSGDYGTLSRLITFSAPPAAAGGAALALNAAAILAAAAVPLLLLYFRQTKILNAAVSVVLIAEAAISAVHAAQIGGAYRAYRNDTAATVGSVSEVTPVYHLSKTGRNVVVFMLDRAENAYLLPIFDAYPALYDVYEGFTLYKNTVSYNEGTLMGAPPLFGGYEYTPAEMNRRSAEKLADKNNEALLMLPRIFTESAGFRATVSDLSWANYSWIPDMRICDPYPQITGLNMERKYTSLWIRENPDKIRPNITSGALRRNLVWFSLFKAAPLFLRESIYDDGCWWNSDEATSDIMEFIDYYSVLDFLPRLTDFTAEGDAFFTIVNDTTHSSQELQAPDYRPAVRVTDKGPKPLSGYSSVCGNVAAYMRIGEWLERLKENGCYDNTRIIMVGDHGIGSDAGRKLDFPEDWPIDYNPDHNHPLLFVKDFGARGKLSVNTDFMTNADVPAIALRGIVENPVNPFTGKEIREISPSEKKASGIALIHNWQPGKNTPYTFKIPDDAWYTVSENLFDAGCWQKGVK